MHVFACAAAFGVCVLLAASAAPTSAAIHSLAGNARFQIGNGLPYPITMSGPPTGAVLATPGATVELISTAAGNPLKMVLKPGRLSAPASPSLVPIWGANPNVFQVRTSLAVQFPVTTATFQVDGRTGAATVTFCPGNTTTVLGDGCLLAPAAPGLMRYTRTAAQFGGPARASFQGSVDFALNASQVTPPATCTSCIVVFGLGTPPGAFGGAFGFSASLPHPALSPGAFVATVLAGGTIFSLRSTLGPGTANPQTSFAGPWTTGRVTVSQPSGSPPQLFVFSGNDARTPGGQGSISLVAGGIVMSTFGGPEVSRSWLNLTVLPEPSALAGLAAGCALVAWLSRRRSRRE